MINKGEKVMSLYKLNKRVRRLKKMNEWVKKHVSNEKLRSSWFWDLGEDIDEADYELVAFDDDMFNSCARIFSKIVVKTEVIAK